MRGIQIETRVRHLERPGDVSGDEAIQFHAADHLDNPAQNARGDAVSQTSPGWCAGGRPAIVATMFLSDGLWKKLAFPIELIHGRAAKDAVGEPGGVPRESWPRPR